MDWQHIKDAAWNSLVNALVFVTVVGTAAKAFYEFWLKKRFKRYESKLDAIAEQNKIKFERVYSQRATAIEALYKMCVELESNATGYIMGKLFISDEKPEFKELAVKAGIYLIGLSQSLEQIYELKQRSKLYFSPQLLAVVEDLTGYCNTLMTDEALPEKNGIAIRFSTFTKKRETLEQVFRKELGSDA